MRALILALAWITPGIIAEILGWKGIWGSGSAFFDSVIPFPVAGGIFHVPSFTVAAALVYSQKRIPGNLAGFVPVISGAVFLGMLALQIDFDRLNGFLFTDYTPSGFPLRLHSNLVYLFITTDAFWVFLHSMARDPKPPARAWSVVAVVPLAVVIVAVAGFKLGGPVFKIGPALSGPQRGQEIRLIYTSGDFDREAFLDWFNARATLSRPWQNPNVEHSAVYFTHSLEAVKWRKLDLVDKKNTVATICLYEEDTSMQLQAGYADCFSGRETVMTGLKRIAGEHATGYGRDIDNWYATVLLCRDVDLPPDKSIGDIRLYRLCRSVKKYHPKAMKDFADRHGKTSAAYEFVRRTAEKYGIAE